MINDPIITHLLPRFSFVKNGKKHMSDNFICPLCGQPMVITSTSVQYDEDTRIDYNNNNPTKIEVDTFCPNGCIQDLHMCISRPVALTTEWD